MDALKKAELAKHQGNSERTLDFPGQAVAISTKSPAPPTPQLAPVAPSLPLVEPDLSAPLSLELLDNPPSKREPSLSQSPSQETLPDSPSSLQLPKLPERMEDLDEQFLSSAAPRVAESFAARSKPVAPSQSAVPPEASTAPETPKVSAENAAENTAKPSRKSPPALNTSTTSSAYTPRAAAAPLKGATATSAKAQDAAKNMFAAKNVLQAMPAPQNRKAFTLALGGLTLLSALGIGGYFWWQLQPKSGLLPIAATHPPPLPQTNTAVTAQASVAPAPPILAPANAAPPPPATAVIPAPTIAEPRPSGSEKLAAVVASPPRSPASLRPTEALPDPDAPVRVTRAPLRVNPQLAKAYEHFERGNLSAARQSYEQVLKTDPHSVDALHGMAALALRDNRPDAAEHYFQRVLLADPQDPHAITGLANLRGHINPGATESRLRGVIAAQPELSAPQFALGNLLSAQERWAEAQQAYFKAYSAEPGNPDILFNLAVSLEHLRQPKLAAQYYGLAIDAASRRPAAFDAAQASSRLRALQP